ncbi:putative DNA-binding domain-containing protein [Shimia sp. CNT1-13L.2]|uniref:HvfC/BufC N-terminal domain-containing protein n=1 Tax=Shimia sp. CNT1-13L.2 TaxID=2959663 RepID=UPI0020CEC7CB|nr:DNA-binding domain-containing protein [Shimia sp. CNT1-13L.2]MCP9481848.1 putative DNA-binding domain-containing protein [Shimia sp. CNT1-13L.2]
MTVSQTDFRSALLDADLPMPEGLVDDQGRPAGRRFSVYRNNVAVSLTEALETAFPAIAKLLGNENFKAIAGVFLRQSPPSSPLMMHYGAAFPDFLRGFEPLAHLGYLGDVAAMEQALRRSYHAEDATPIAGDALAQFPEDQLADVRLTLAPSVELLASPWPIYDIWAFNMRDGAPKPRPVAQEILITRVEFDPEPHLLGPGAAVFIRALQNGKTLGEAAEDATTHSAEFDLGACLTLLLTEQALTTATL